MFTGGTICGFDQVWSGFRGVRHDQLLWLFNREYRKSDFFQDLILDF